MLTDAQGNPIVREGRSIKISETTTPDGRKMWGIDFAPDIASFEFEEVIMILSDVTRGIAQQARSKVAEARAIQAAKAKIAALGDV
jgi:hypothetical protein